MKKIGLIVLGVWMLAGGWVWLNEPKQLPAPTESSIKPSLAADLLSLPDHSYQQFDLGGRNLTLEVVNTPTSITTGLSGRQTLGADGMLFVFAEPVEAEFWMKEMRFDIDIIWLSQARVVGIEKNLPRPMPGQTLTDLPIYRSPQSVEMVLEVAAGRSSDWQIEVGDTLSPQSLLE